MKLGLLAGVFSGLSFDDLLPRLRDEGLDAVELAGGLEMVSFGVAMSTTSTAGSSTSRRQSPTDRSQPKRFALSAASSSLRSATT